MSRVEVATLLGGLHAHTEAKRDICNAKNDNSNVGRGIFCDSCEVTLEDVVSVEEGLFTVWFDPDFILAVFCEMVEACNAELELLGFSKFAKDDSRGKKFVFPDVRCHFENFCVKVVDTVSVETEYMLAVLTIDQEFDVAA